MKGSGEGGIGGEKSFGGGMIRREWRRDFGRALSIGQREEFCVWH